VVSFIFQFGSNFAKFSEEEEKMPFFKKMTAYFDSRQNSTATQTYSTDETVIVLLWDANSTVV